MAHYFGDVVLLPFPFTDQSGAKKRPAVIVSSMSYNGKRRDIVIMAITSQVRKIGDRPPFQMHLLKFFGLPALAGDPRRFNIVSMSKIGK